MVEINLQWTAVTKRKSQKGVFDQIMQYNVVSNKYCVVASKFSKRRVVQCFKTFSKEAVWSSGSICNGAENPKIKLLFCLLTTGKFSVNPTVNGYMYLSQNKQGYDSNRRGMGSAFHMQMGLEAHGILGTANERQSRRYHVSLTPSSPTASKCRNSIIRVICKTTDKQNRS